MVLCAMPLPLLLLYCCRTSNTVTREKLTVRYGTTKKRTRDRPLSPALADRLQHGLVVGDLFKVGRVHAEPGFRPVRDTVRNKHENKCDQCEISHKRKAVQDRC